MRLPRWGWVLVALGALVLVGLGSTALYPTDRTAFIEWVRTNAPANTDSDEKLARMADEVCKADPEDRYEMGVPVGFVSAALGLYCPGHK
jgi:hypothetical protein